MRHRVEASGGHLDISSTDKGTTISATLPLVMLHTAVAHVADNAA
jgi:signal transduction histidine kinase